MEVMIEKLFRKHLNLSIAETETLTGGQVGRVFRVRTAAKDYVIKFVETYKELPFNEELVDDRVYGSRWSNLVPTYELLMIKNIPTPTLYASGTLTENQLNYAIFDFLSGDTPDYSPAWFSCLGNEMAFLHAVTRPYQGWVSMNEPYRESWEDAFRKSLQSQMIGAKEFIHSDAYTAILNYIDRTLLKFESPDNFVLSHTDGIQAVFEKVEGWRMKGVIDVEDYQFTDQRFALAGVELINALEGHLLLESFWQSYAKITPVEESYEDVKVLFQIYYLLVWIRVLQGQNQLVAKNTAYLESIVK
jgi:fructosamine-3-kinase